MSTTVTSSDDGGWDDTEIVDYNECDIRMEVSYISNKQQHSCWKCCQCDLINKVELTIQKYDMKCCGCGNTKYIPDETEIIMSAHWNSPQDYYLKFNLIEKPKPIWICNACFYHNHNLKSNKCEICETIKANNNNPNTYDANKLYEEKKLICWHCQWKNIVYSKSLSRCTKCGYCLPLSSKYAPKYMELVSGFCCRHILNIPADIEHICLKYLGNIVFDCDILLKKIFEFSYGKHLIFFPDRYIWRVQVKSSLDLVIGVRDGSYYYGLTNNGTLWSGNDSDETNISYYCPSFVNGDVVTVVIDCRNGTLSYALNNEWYAAAFDKMITPCYGYQLFIKSPRSDSVSLLDE